MFRLFRFLKGYEKESILGPLFKFFEATLELFVPLAVASLIDVGIGENDFAHSMKMFFVLCLLGIVGLVFSLTAQYYAAKAAVGFVKKIKQALFSHMGTLSYGEIDQLTTSTMITAMTSDMNQIQSGMNMALRLLLRSPFVVGGAFLMTWLIDPQVAKIFGLTILGLILVVFGIIFFTVPLYKSVQEKLGKVLAATRENLRGVRVVRAFGMEKEEIKSFVQKQEELTKTQKFVGNISGLLNPLSYTVINIGVVLLIHKGALRVEYGVLTQGAVVALYNYMAQILEELVKLANTIILLTKMIASGNRVQSVFERTSSQSFPELTEEGKEEGKEYLAFHQVSLTYPKAMEASLKDISFTAKKGDVIGVIGSTGSGKTSLINMLSRFYDPDSGEIYLEGRRLEQYSKKELRDKVALVPQKSVLFSGTIAENLRFANEGATEEEMWRALEIAQAKEIVEKKEGKLQAGVSQKGSNFSGGQRQRLCIARALVKKADILILDDSFSALDYATDLALRKALKEMEEKPLMLLVSQRTTSIKEADKILVLEEGELVGAGTHEQLLQECKIYQEIHASQFKKEVEKE
ncbi:MAG: ABC transporter ATP-binding protein [Lachnospiraceae bacterium]|nr:ABC transporter ATP-binding protein [Lachnospiraceae bacterium]